MPHYLPLDVVPEGSLDDDHGPDVDLDPALDTDGDPGRVEDVWVELLVLSLSYLNKVEKS